MSPPKPQAKAKAKAMNIFDYLGLATPTLGCGPPSLRDPSGG